MGYSGRLGGSRNSQHRPPAALKPAMKIGTRFLVPTSSTKSQTTLPLRFQLYGTILCLARGQLVHIRQGPKNDILV